MSKIANAFKDSKAFIGFLTAGDPTIEKNSRIYFGNGRSRLRFNRNWNSVFRSYG